MIQRKIVFVIFLLSLTLYFFAPNVVDKGFCWLCLALYLIEVFIILKIEFKSKIYISFNTLFFLSFFLTSFAYPLFVHGTPAELLGNVEKQINFNYLSKCSALCLIASSIYSYGYLKAINTGKCKGFFNRYARFEDPFPGMSVLKLLYLVIFFLLFITVFNAIISGQQVYIEGGELFSSLFETIFPVMLLCNSCQKKPDNLLSFVKLNARILASGIIMMLLFMKVGDRGLIITCGIEIVAVYILCVKRLRPLEVFSMVILGAIFMFVIRQTRISDSYSSVTSSLSSFFSASAAVISSGGVEYGLWYYLSDLTNISWELCLGYEYSLNNELFHPIEEIILNIVSPVPLLPSFVSNVFFGRPTMDYNTGMALNSYMSAYGDGNFGNHCVIDVFMMWGLIGVLIIFFYFGYFVAKCYNNSFDKVLWTSIYILLISNAVYVPRNMVLSLIRPVVYVWFFVWVAKRTPKRLDRNVSLEKNE